MHNRKKIIYVLGFVIGVCIIALFFVQWIRTKPTEQEVWAEETILLFMEAKGREIKPSTDEYMRFMRGILLGEYPELTGVNSEYIEGQDELDYILMYAWKHSGYGDVYGDYPELDAGQAPSPPSNDDN